MLKIKAIETSSDCIASIAMKLVIASLLPKYQMFFPN